MDTPLQTEQVPLKSRVWVSAADGAIATLQGMIGSGALTYYFTRWRGMDPNLAGIVWLLFGIWNAINDPLFGYISDRTRSKLGRRIPYIRYGAPLYALAFIACWVNWPGTQSNQTLMFIQLLTLLFIFDTLYTAIATSVYIMPYEMALSTRARGSIFVWKILFQLLATAVPLILVPIIQPGPGEDATTFRWIMTAFGIGVGLVVYFSTFFYEEKHFQQEEEQPPFLTALKECFTNRSFLVFETISFTIIYIQTALMQGVLYYFDELKVPGTPLYAALGIGVVLGVVLWVQAVRRKGVKFSMRGMTLVFAIGCLIMLMGGRQVAFATLGFFLFGVGFAGGMYLIPLMNGDVIDMDEHRTGLRREGMYAGVNSFITKPAISIAQAAFLWILGIFGYDQSLAKGLQSASAQTGILVAWTLIPALLMLICFVLLRWYPLAGAEWEAIKEKLAEIHREKERRYLEAHGLRFVE
ncbi:MAG: MFS transporter [Anaerolineae bacterium]|nr:MAG: MFS transporter [Anaerolineae bacterium]